MLFCIIQFTKYSLTFHPGSDRDEDKEVTHVLSVALRHRQIPSRLRKFLCLKPGSSLSQTYWMEEETEKREMRGTKARRRVSNRTGKRKVLAYSSSGV